jgi:hypothetical protein
MNNVFIKYAKLLLTLAYNTDLITEKAIFQHQILILRYFFIILSLSHKNSDVLQFVIHH